MKKLLMMTVMMGAFAAPIAFTNIAHAEDKGGMWFSKVDTNSDGMISKAEHEKASADKFAKMDANGDGNVTKEEAKAAKEKMKEEWKEKKAK